MNVKSRILTIRLMERAVIYPEYIKEIGMSVHMDRTKDASNKNTNTQGDKNYGLEEK